jgi:predicted AlkP superfamily pyrophosphatase or phosphodiesterase
MKNKLLVFCLDALCTMDIELMRTMPNFKFMFEQGSWVTHMHSIYPSITYPCHCSIITGNYVEKHGVPHNEIVEAGDQNAPWYNMRKDVKSKTLLDYAKDNGYTTCSLSWPVSGGADYDLNMPMIVPIGYNGPNPVQFFESTATRELLDRYFDQYGHHLIGDNRSLDKYTMGLASDIIKDYSQPDVMLVKMCDLDTIRHQHGVMNDHVMEQLLKHDTEFGILLDQIRKYGDFEHTNFVILGDHGQTDIDHVLNFNILLKQAGFITVDQNNQLVDYDAYCHSVGMSAWISLKNPSDEMMKQKVYDYLLSVKADPKYGLGHVFTKEEVREQYKLTGPFEFVIEGRSAISFGNTLSGDDVFASTGFGDYKTARASHGGLPYKEQHTAFIACGPSVKQGVVIDQANLVDMAPTMAAMLQFTMEDVDGNILDKLLK